MVKQSDLTKEWYTPGDVADMLGVVPMTIITYDNKGLIEFERTPTNRRIISRDNLIKYFRSVDVFIDDPDSGRFDAIYARVSTQLQLKRGDLDNQINTILMFCATQNPKDLKIYKDVGSGLNDSRKDLSRLIQDIEKDKVNRIYITYKDRLTRFGFNYIDEICKIHNTSIIQVSKDITTKSAQEELAEDLCSIIHSFGGKLYGLRRSKLAEINEKISNIKEVNDTDDTC